MVAQQVLEIQMAVKAKVSSFMFEGSQLTLRPTCNVFITMNPGYAGALRWNLCVPGSEAGQGLGAVLR